MNLQEWCGEGALFADMAESSVSFLESVAREVSVDKDETIFRMDSPADHLYLITSGTAALRITGPSGPAVTIQTLGEGSLLGLSWRLPPYRWQWNCQAIVDSKLASFDANRVLSACEEDPRLDSDLWRVVAKESSKRLHNVRMQLLDLYGMR